MALMTGSVMAAFINIHTEYAIWILIFATLGICWFRTLLSVFAGVFASLFLIMMVYEFNISYDWIAVGVFLIFTSWGIKSYALRETK